MTTSTVRPYKGVFPVVPTVFDGDGRLDLDGQKRAVDLHDRCRLAGTLHPRQLLRAVRADRRRARHRCWTRCWSMSPAGFPVIVTTTHFARHICAERSRRAQEAGAAMVMVMPPYHGATFRVGEAGIYEFYRAVSDAISIPIMVQDAPVAGTPLSAAFLARMAREIEAPRYFKIEMPQAAAKLRELIAARRRGDRGAVGRRGGDHADGRSRRRRDRRHDRRRLSRRHPADHRSLFRRPPRRGGRRLCSAGCR